MEIKRLDPGVALQLLGLKYILVLTLVNLGVVLDFLHVIQFLAQHFGNQLHPGKILDHIFAYQLAVTQNRDLVTDLIHLIQEMGNKDNPHAPRPQIAHQPEQLFHLRLIQRRGRLIQYQHLTIHVHSPGDGHHLLNGNRTVRKLLGRLCRNPQIIKNPVRILIHLLPVGQFGAAPADIHILRHRQVRAEGNLLIYGADSQILRILRGPDHCRLIQSVQKDLSLILLIDTSQNLD